MFSKLKRFFVSLFGPKKTTKQCLEELVEQVNQEGYSDLDLKQGAELPAESLEEVFNREYPVCLDVRIQSGTPHSRPTTAETILGSHKEFSIGIDPLAHNPLVGVGPKSKKKTKKVKSKKKQAPKSKKKTKKATK